MSRFDSVRPEVHVVLDNASVHLSKETEECLAK